MNEKLIDELFEEYEKEYGFDINNETDLFEAQKNLLGFVIKAGRKLENNFFNKIGTGYEGKVVKKKGMNYEHEGNRKKSIHGLFGVIDYKRAYYSCSQTGNNGYIPLDEKLGITKKHTPGCNYFFSFFTSQDVYQDSLNRFHEIFRPDGKDLISMRKVLDMDYKLGEELLELRRQEIIDMFENGKEIEKEDIIKGAVAVSIDATKVREKLGEKTGKNGKKKIDIGFKDAKIAAISEISWDKEKKEPFCTNTSYVSGIEHADDFFKRIWVEINRRSDSIKRTPFVFLGDGAEWIWDRVSEISNEHSIEVLDFFHASEHLSDLCKFLYGEDSIEYRDNYEKWRSLIYKGKIKKVIKTLKKLQDNCMKSSHRDELQRQINYFENNQHRMRYDKFREMKIPIGSGTIESACKHVIGKRLKLSGMIWSSKGAEGMLQIRASYKSGRFRKDFAKIIGKKAA